MSKRPIGDDSSHTNGATKKAKLYGTKPTISEILINSRVVLSQLPEVPADLDHTNVLEWATLLQKVVEQFNLHISCISAATYKWGSDRTGAGDQHLQTLSSELMNAQEQVSANVSRRLENVLVPSVEVLPLETTQFEETIDGKKVTKRTTTYQHVVSDPKFVNLCKDILVRNKEMIHEVVRVNFAKVCQALEDFEKAQKKESSVDRSMY